MSNVVSISSRSKASNSKTTKNIANAFAIDKANTDLYRVYNPTNLQVYKWNGVYFELQANDQVETEAYHFVNHNQPDKALEPTYRNCITNLKLRLSSEGKFLGKTTPNQFDELPDSLLLPLQNTYLKVTQDSVEFINICKSHCFDYAINASLADCYPLDVDVEWNNSQFKSFIEEILPNESTRKAVQQYIGYTLTNSVALQKAQMWLGEGRNGKSTLIQIVSALHNKVVTYNPAHKSEFGLAGIKGANFIIVNEMEKYNFNEQEVKQLISGDMIQMREMRENPYPYFNKAKMVFIGNHPPKNSDQSEGFWRRFQFVNFVKTINHEAVNERLTHDIITKELHLVLKWAIEGLQTVLTTKKLSTSEEMVNFGKNIALKSNTVELFLDSVEHEIYSYDEAKTGNDGRTDTTKITSKADVIDEYKSWCEKYHYTYLKGSEFYNNLERHFKKHGKTMYSNVGKEIMSRRDCKIEAINAFACLPIVFK